MQAHRSILAAVAAFGLVGAGGGSDQVDEEHGDELALLVRRGLRGQPGSAVLTEPSILGDRFAAPRAGLHASEA